MCGFSISSVRWSQRQITEVRYLDSRATIGRTLDRWHTEQDTLLNSFFGEVLGNLIEFGSRRHTSMGLSVSGKAALVSVA